MCCVYKDSEIKLPVLSTIVWPMPHRIYMVFEQLGLIVNVKPVIIPH